MAVAVAICLLAVASSEKLTEQFGGKTVGMEYETELFDTSEVISIDILMDEDEWNDMLSNAISEEYYKCDVVVNGTKFSNVAIRPKGNTSLSAIAMDPDSERYSFKLEFGHYVDGQTCFGLDKLILNNNYADATNMKEAVVYDMYQYLGADASLYNYASISVNGEYRGVYLALEGVETSFMLRNYGTQDGELYKPDSMEMGGTERRGGRIEQKEESSEDASANSGADAAGSESGSGRDKGGPGGFSMGGNGANLNYTDDDLDSYSTIWDSEITGTSDKDHRRVVTALKNISEGTDLEKYLDIDNVLKYMAVHTFAVNMDSLSGSMAHNYYLYEYDGQLNIIPWDYNLSFGGMSMGGSSASDMINDAIDTPFSGTQFFDSLLANDEYREKYHEYLQQLVDEYVNGGRFDESYSRIRTQIDQLVETDPTASYSYDEYKTAADMLYKTVKLRAESIDGQIAGTIPSTDEGQRQDSSALVDASEIDVEAMGQFDMGGGGGFSKPSGDNDSSSEKSEESKSDNSSSNPFGTPPNGNMPDMGNFDPNNMPNMGDNGSNPFGTPPDGNMPDMGNFDPNNMPNMGDSTQDSGEANRQQPSFSGAPDSPGGMTSVKNLATYGICLVVMLTALILAARFRRRR